MNGNPPYAIPANIQTMSVAITGSELNELPSLDYACKCRFIVKNINDMLAAFRLGKADN